MNTFESRTLNITPTQSHSLAPTSPTRLTQRADAGRTAAVVAAAEEEEAERS